MSVNDLQYQIVIIVLIHDHIHFFLTEPSVLLLLPRENHDDVGSRGMTSRRELQQNNTPVWRRKCHVDVCTMDVVQKTKIYLYGLRINLCRVYGPHLCLLNERNGCHPLQVCFVQSILPTIPLKI